jgi:hypothetical protein
VGTIHFPPYVNEKVDVSDCLRQIAQNHIKIVKGDYIYTICTIEDVPGVGVAGLLLKFAQKASEEVFNYDVWAPREYGVEDKVIIGSRFLVGEGNLIVLEDKPPQLARTNFANRLEELLAEVVREELPVFELDVYFHKDPTRIQKFITEHDVVSSIALTNIKIKNPLPRTKDVDTARSMIADMGMAKCEIENPKEGINKDGHLFRGFVNLSEEGQLDMEICAPKADRSGRVSIDSFLTKLKLLRRRVEIEKGMCPFINEAGKLLKTHLRRHQQDK